uniref:Peptidoglycan-recognition protein n=1 Tax=Antheraea pernyi TaxID=7119 RepID=A0A125S9Y4_ANTPE|nr:peptidoglycan recognition protein C [Antheraea pernyi]
MSNIIYYSALLFVSASVSGFPGAIRSPDDTFPLCTRACWGAKPPTDTRALNTSVPYVIIHHTAIPAACHTTDQCILDMQSMQNVHNGLGWGDIGYNFCVGSDGIAYEGRGWKIVGIHAGNANSQSVGICLIGDWRVDLPPAKQLSTTKSLIAQGVQLGVISPDYKLMGHSQVMATECPGTALLTHLSTWKHFHPGHVEFLSKTKNKKV